MIVDREEYKALGPYRKDLHWLREIHEPGFRSAPLRPLKNVFSKSVFKGGRRRYRLKLGEQKSAFQTEWNRAVKASLSCFHAEALFLLGKEEIR